MSGRAFLWTGRRDRLLWESRTDGFTFKECAAIIGCGCTEADARARWKILRDGQKINRAIGGPVGGSMAAASSKLAMPARPDLIPLPKYGEMEKKYDRATRVKLGIE